MSRYIIVCRDDGPGKTHGKYVAAVDLMFTAEGAARYAAAVPPSLEPRIVTTAEYLLICDKFKLEEQWL